ncbi:non-specific lipid transfer protein GPI-anchored 20 isoform X2 [Henckelia pumila]|uniref:non-specific lipid transfer protein GPI-anchored 20 isoform X2 n=1 Tax=Henckelia pumila TaxID=405737 RepID=UPI003C6E835D
MALHFLITFLAIATIALLSTSSGQITPSTPCTSSMITSFMPCVNFVTNGTVNSTTPPPACCTSLGSLMNNGKDCLCQIATGNVPFQVPVNQTLAISLPRACNMPGVPLQCKAVGAPVPAPAPAPGPLASSQITLPPNAAPSPSIKDPSGAEPLSPRLAPEAEPTTPTSPSPPTTTGGAPADNTGSRAGVTPSAAGHSFSASSPLLLVAVLGAVAFKYY